MSHLSILPTVLRDETLLAQVLQDLGLEPLGPGHLRGFAGERQSVLLRVQLPEGLWLAGAVRAMAALPWWVICSACRVPARCSP